MVHLTGGHHRLLRCHRASLPDCPTLEVSRVIDGDTFDSPAGRVRLSGVDTPERGQRCSKEATDRLRQLAGTTVRVEAGPRETDRYGRLLYYVYTESGASIDAALVRDGLARAWTRDGQHRDKLVQIERDAQGSRTGCIW
ncbi:MAG: thermonuclease family protein [Chloroflexi bacterium]|nr:thermonuclease family protein [Chloroflexota bacterium]MCI0896120.1 thermonuclease family protein [Chloroflexota bacterium]